jgi:hypothetical protein
MVLFPRFHARVAELVDAHDSKSCGATHEGSIPSPGTNFFGAQIFLQNRK